MINTTQKEDQKEREKAPFLTKRQKGGGECKGNHPPGIAQRKKGPQGKGPGKEKSMDQPGKRKVFNHNF